MEVVEEDLVAVGLEDRVVVRAEEDPEAGDRAGGAREVEVPGVEDPAMATEIMTTRTQPPTRKPQPPTRKPRPPRQRPRRSLRKRRHPRPSPHLRLPPAPAALHLKVLR
jgi:hypothetical protein